MSVETRADDGQSYERAVASLAAGHKDATVMAGHETPRGGGNQGVSGADRTCQGHGQGCSRYFEEEATDQFGNIEQPTVGDVCYRLVRHEVEGAWPKGFRDYQVLTKENVTSWWDKHRTKTLHEMRLETVRISLDRAKKELEKVKSETTEAAVQFLTARLKTLQEN